MRCAFIQKIFTSSLSFLFGGSTSTKGREPCSAHPPRIPLSFSDFIFVRKMLCPYKRYTRTFCVCQKKFFLLLCFFQHQHFFFFFQNENRVSQQGGFLWIRQKAVLVSCVKCTHFVWDDSYFFIPFLPLFLPKVTQAQLGIFPNIYLFFSPIKKKNLISLDPYGIFFRVWVTLAVWEGGGNIFFCLFENFLNEHNKQIV